MKIKSHRKPSEKEFLLINAGSTPIYQGPLVISQQNYLAEPYVAIFSFNYLAISL